MKAVLCGSSKNVKLYYLLDAGKGEKDGAVVTNDGRVIRVDFFSFASSSSDIRKITKTPFHKFLWTEPDGEMKKIWFDTFISKSREISKKFKDTVVIHSQLGNVSKKQKKIEVKIKSFLSEDLELSADFNNFSRLDKKTKAHQESHDE